VSPEKRSSESPSSQELRILSQRQFLDLETEYTKQEKTKLKNTIDDICKLCNCELTLE
jgi:hypothetical protein